MRRKILALWLMPLLKFTAFADVPSHWLEVRTEHFTILTDAGEKQAKHVAGGLERMQSAFAKLLPGARADQGSRIVVLAFKDRKGFQALEPQAYLQKGALDLAGYFLNRQDKSYILLRLDAGDRPYATVYHEYTHYMTRHAKTVPLWLNEGLAEFYQNADLSERVIRLGQPSANDLRFLRGQHLLPLSTLFSVDQGSPYYHENEKGDVFYAESWALTHLLTIEDFGKTDTRLRRYVRALDEGETGLKAAETAFGDLTQLQEQLATYVDQSQFRELSMPLGSTVPESSFHVDPMPEPEVKSIRADILIENGRKREARALLEEVLREAPADTQAHESMGLLCLRDGDMLGARKWYGGAARLHSPSYLTYYYYGSLSLREGASGEADAGESLRQALKLNPQFVPALEALSQYDVMRHENLDEAIQMSVRAVELEPDVLNHRLNAAQIRLERDEFVAALSILEEAVKIAHNQDDVARVQERVNEIELEQARLQRGSKAEAPRVLSREESAQQRNLNSNR